jgi:hypothetical protein
MTSHQLLGTRPKHSDAQRTPGVALFSLVSRGAKFVVLIGIAAAVSAQAGIPTYDYHVPCTPENAIFGHFSSTKKPVITVPSGAVVRIDGGGGRTGSSRRSTPPPAPGGVVASIAPLPPESDEDRNRWYKENGIPLTVDDPIVKEISRAQKESPNKLAPPPGSPAGTGFGGHFLIGPVAIEGAEPGDSLEVRVLDVTPRLPYGSNSASPTGGGLPGVMPRPFSKVYKLDLKRNAAIYDENVEIPLAPFNGVNGTCPPDSEGPDRRSTQPGLFGGNLDSKDLVTGSTLFLPIFQKGALFYTGD